MPSYVFVPDLLDICNLHAISISEYMKPTILTVQELLLKYMVMVRIIIAYSVYTRTQVKYRTATRITSIYSIENSWYVETFLASKYNPNVISVAQILGIYKVCKLPYIPKSKFYLLQGHIYLGNVSSLLVRDPSTDPLLHWHSPLSHATGTTAESELQRCTNGSPKFIQPTISTGSTEEGNFGFRNTFMYHRLFSATILRPSLYVPIITL